MKLNIWDARCEGFRSILLPVAPSWEFSVVILPPRLWREMSASEGSSLLRSSACGQGPRHESSRLPESALVAELATLSSTTSDEKPTVFSRPVTVEALGSLARAGAGVGTSRSTSVSLNVEVAGESRGGVSADERLDVLALLMLLSLPISPCLLQPHEHS